MPSLDVTLARIAELRAMIAPQAAPAATPAVPGGQATAFAGQLQAALGGTGAPVATPASLLGTTATTSLSMPTGGTSAGQAIVGLVRQEVGVAEQPPGSNDSPRIAQYRQATVGSGVGPWCAYFTSWAAREAGVPLGDSGQGFGLVSDVWSWGRRTGKAIPAGSGTPAPGDLIVWGGSGHIGVVEQVLADGRVQTIEGNSSDQVSRRVHDASGGGALGYMRLG